MKFNAIARRSASLGLLLAAAVATSGCASLKSANLLARASVPGSGPAAGPGSASPPAGAASGASPVGPARPDPAAPRPFDDVVKGARQTNGLFITWQKDEKVWIELKPEDFDKPFFFSPKLAQGIGEAGIFGGTMIGRYARFGTPQMVEFKRVHNQVQLVARNAQYIAKPGTPEGFAVQAGFSASLMASSAVASAPHKDRKSVLVEANSLFLGDLLGLGMVLQQSFRQGYGLDPRHTAFTAVRGTPEQVVFNVRAHYATASLAVPGPVTLPGLPMPSLPSTLPDARSMFIGLHYSLSRLPEQPMRPRAADPRVGYFQTTVDDFSDDLARSPRQRFVNRWRLDKKDPTAALSEPVKPITYWLDKTVPLKYRDAITKGVLAWNDAFERIGFKDAIVVKVQPDDADFDTLDVGVASIRWMTNAQPRFGAIGPSQVDPRTGEILDADIGFESLSSRGLRATRARILGGATANDWPALLQAHDTVGTSGRAEAVSAHAAHGAWCQHAEFASEQLAYAFDVLAARGDIDPSAPEAQQFVLDYLTDTTMHEVGHTLGLRHNFRSSTIYTPAQMADPAFTRAQGLAGSVMEYAPINLGVPGAPPPAAFQTVLGPYDHWAIEYAYKPIDPTDEKAELARIAGRSAEPQLAYGTDEDNFLGLDPESLMFDLGNDPVAFAKRRLAIAKDLIHSQESRGLKPDEDYSVLRRAVGFAVRDAGRAAGILQRQIGGLRTLRDYAHTGRDPLQPVPAELQRQALDVLSTGVFSPVGLQASPGLQRRLAPDFLERGDAVFDGSLPQATDFSPSNMVLDLQRALLGQLMSDGLAARILDNQAKVDASARPGAGQAFQLSELYARLSRDVWSELATGSDIAPGRRELQREHLNRLANLLLRPAAQSRADARGLVRREALALMRRLDRPIRSAAGLGPETRAHLSDSADTLRQALGAKLPRGSV
jgi:Met-zincin/Domain of unknown function (DUF5117)